jgi:hypothetical protein
MLARQLFGIAVKNAAMLLFLLFGGSASAQYGDTNADTWARSIQSDINNGAPKEQICNNAMNSAKISDVARFKDWAYGVVRRYCPEQLGEKQAVSTGKEKPGNAADCSFNIYQMNLAAQGKRVEVVGSFCYATFN